MKKLTLVAQRGSPKITGGDSDGSEKRKGAAEQEMNA